MGLGCRRSLVVHGEDGMDEITLSGTTHVVEQKDGKMSSYELTPEEFGLRRVPLESLTMPDKAAAIRTARALIQGEAEQHLEDLVLLNAGAGIYAGGKAGSIAEGLERARDSLRSGAARTVLESVVSYTAGLRQAAE